MRNTWETVFHPNKGNDLINTNTKAVNTWYKSIKLQLKHDDVIDFHNLIPNHPILREITLSEFKNAIKHTKDKAPGVDNIKVPQLKYLPNNILLALTNLHNATLASKYYSKTSKVTNMIFI